MTQDRLIFFGTDAFSVPTLVRLLADGRNVVAVVTKPDSRTGRGQEMSPPAVKRLAEANKIPVYQPARLSDVHDDLAKLAADAGVVVAYGKIIPQSILDIFPKGLINVHASLLPAYRGASPIETAILNGDNQAGVTLMRIDAGMDTGPAYDASKIQLIGTETRHDLYEQLAELGADLLGNKISAILEGNLVPTPQDSTHASHVGLIKKSDGEIDWTKPAVQLEREIRAYLGWPGSHTKLLGVEVKITAAHIDGAESVEVTTQQHPHISPGTPVKSPSGDLAVETIDGSLIIDRLKPAGKREMTVQEFLAGHPLS